MSSEPSSETFTWGLEAVPLPQIRIRWYRRLLHRLFGVPLPRPSQPAGTVPVAIGVTNADGSFTRLYIPAARITSDRPQ
jgi:hypothetical protein